MKRLLLAALLLASPALAQETGASATRSAKPVITTTTKNPLIREVSPTKDALRKATEEAEKRAAEDARKAAEAAAKKSGEGEATVTCDEETLAITGKCVPVKTEATPTSKAAAPVPQATRSDRNLRSDREMMKR